MNGPSDGSAAHRARGAARPGVAGRGAGDPGDRVPVVRRRAHRLAGGTGTTARGGGGGSGGTARDQWRRRSARIVWVGALIVGLAVYIGFSLNRSADRIVEKQTTVATAETLSAVADPLAALCAQDPTIRARVGAACDTAAQAVVAAPVVAAAARDGHDGVAGTAGLNGVAGLNGRDGRGITSTSIVAGRLVLTYSDGATQDVGEVVGADGKSGVDGKAGTDGHPGADGAAGAVGAPGGLPASYTTFFTDGTSQACTRSGGDDSAPTYQCGDRG